MRLARILFIITLLSGKIVAQITISHPLNNAVYQRNSASQANLIISGTYNQSVATSIQARLINPDNGLPIGGFDWTILVSNPALGFFQGQLSNVPAGWYKLEVRCVKSGTVLEAAEVNRVGIGDVFMVAGQSNAQGYLYDQYIGATSNKVVTHNNGRYCNTEEIQFPVFSQLLGQTRPGVNGRDAWAYGRLGDNILNTTGFPVAIFNAGASGSSILNWKETSDDFSTIHALTNNYFCSSPDENSNYANPGYINGNSTTYETKNPYKIFKKAMNFYNSMFGARTVLWHQGESDTYKGTEIVDYQNNLLYVINKSRNDFAANLPWVIARVSHFGHDMSGPIVSSKVISAQNNLINLSGTDQIFAGPETDGINNTTMPTSRGFDDIHFSGTLGLTALADGWSNSLNSSFFSSSTPVVANTPPNVSASIISSSQVTLNVPPGYASYKWIRTDLTGDSSYGSFSEGSTNILTKSTGRYRCWVSTANGNLQVSSEVDVTKVLNLSFNGATCSAHQYVSDLKFVSATNGLGPIEIDKTVGNSGDGDGSSIVLKGVSYPKGIGVAPNSEIIYNIPSGQFYKFNAKIGISDDVAGCTNTGGVVFKVYGNSTLLYSSPTVYRNTAVQDINISIASFSSIKLVVEAVGVNTSCNKAIWADARIMCILGDTVNPTSITNLVATDTLTKCLTFQWLHATDDQQVAGYYISVNGFPIDTISYTQNTFTVTGLSGGDIINFGVQAFDLVNNQSDIVSIIRTTYPRILVSYNSLDDYFCVSRSYLPILKVPEGGVFSMVSGPSSTIDPNTGEFFSNNLGEFTGNYLVSNGIAACMENANFVVATIAPPATTPTVSVDKSIINQGTIVNFSSTSCSSSTLVWSFIGGNNSTIAYSPTSTGFYYSACKIQECYNYSNVVSVKVIPNCGSAVSLVSGTDNLNSNINALNFRSSNTIIATNQIIPINDVQYNAANSITLNPGFKVDSGVIFSAKIQNCP